MREFLRDEETGLVFAAGDSNALAMAVLRLLDDPVLRERLGQAGRHVVLERYDWDAVAERYAGIIEAMVPKADLQGGS